MTGLGEMIAHDVLVLDKRLEDMTEAEHKISDAFVRIGVLVGADNHPLHDPTFEQVVEYIEDKVRELVEVCKLHKIFFDE